MNGKKETTVYGNLIRPLAVGEKAFIRTAWETLYTSTVLAITLVSPQEIAFETVNTKYTLQVPAVARANAVPAMSGFAA